MVLDVQIYELTKKARKPMSAGFHAPSGVRTLDTLIKSQVLYQLS